MKKILISLGVFILIIPAGIIGFLMFSIESTCVNEIFSEINSPNQELKAVLFQRDCGATTGFSTQVSVISIAESLPNEGGNVLVIDGHPNDTQLEISWLSNNELNISKNLNGSEYKAEKRIELSRIILVNYGKN